MSDRLLLAVFHLEMTKSLAAAGDFACPPPTRPRRPKAPPLACTCAARSPVVRPPPRARPPPRERPGRRRGHAGQCFIYRLFEGLFKDCSWSLATGRRRRH